MDLDMFEGKEVFLAGIDGDLEDNGEMAVFGSFLELNDYISILSPLTEPNLVVIHGILTSARYIPSEPYKNAYIVVKSPTEFGSGCMYETNELNADEMSKEVENLFTIDSQCPYNDITIDDIYILYGYELNLGFSISPDEIDLEAINSCEEVALVAKEMRIGKRSNS